jgi:hypothetical protein
MREHDVKCFFVFRAQEDNDCVSPSGLIAAIGSITRANRR